MPELQSLPVKRAVVQYITPNSPLCVGDSLTLSGLLFEEGGAIIRLRKDDGALIQMFVEGDLWGELQTLFGYNIDLDEIE